MLNQNSLQQVVNLAQQKVLHNLGDQTTDQANVISKNINTTSKTPRISLGKKVEKLWGFMKIRLSEELKPEHYKAWVENSVRFYDYDVETKVATFAVVNAYVQTWVINNAQTTFCKLCTELLSDHVNVNFIVKSEVFRTSMGSKNSPLLDPQRTQQLQLNNAINQANLNKKFQLEDFVVGLSNQLAHAAATAVINSLGAVYNPLFLWGNVGIGKTHLLQAIGLAVLKKDQLKKVLYCPSESFLNQMVRAISTKKTAEFRAKFRQLDVLLIDDIQFISKWEATQDELFHTFNELSATGKQIVFVSDRPPQEIAKLTDRLRSRFEGGLVADMHMPDFETRMAILQHQAKLTDSPLTQETLRIIAEEIQNNARELEGAFNKLNAVAKLSDQHGGEFDRRFVLEQVGRNSKKQLIRVKPKQIVDTVCKSFNVTLREIKGSSRVQRIVLPRQVIMHLLRQELHLPYKEVAGLLGRNDHTTVLHGIRKVKRLVEMDRSLRDKLEKVRRDW